MINLTSEQQVIYTTLTTDISIAKAGGKTDVIIDLPENNDLSRVVEKLVKEEGYRYIIAGRGNRIISWFDLSTLE